MNLIGQLTFLEDQRFSSDQARKKGELSAIKRFNFSKVSEILRKLSAVAVGSLTNTRQIFGALCQPFPNCNGKLVNLQEQARIVDKKTVNCQDKNGFVVIFKHRQMRGT